MKRILTITIVLVVLVLLAVWSPWLRWNIDVGAIFGIKKPDQIAGLQVSSLSGELEVFIDNNSVGKAQADTPFYLDNVAPGDHLLALKKTGEFASTYWTFNKLINFEQGSTVVIAYNIGPSEQFSEGNVIYSIKKSDPQATSQLTINLDVEDFSLSIDGVAPDAITGKTVTMDLDLNTQHKIKISKNNYESFEFTILPEAQTDRDKLKPFDLNIDVKLMLQPVEVNTI